jgi:acyl-CoA reductase-like NAD-dependent aldehyde dehydrogenase
MAATATENRLLIGGEWTETGEWLEVRSPYSGEVVGRVAKAGAQETRRAIDAAAAAMREPPADKVQCEEVFGPVVTLTRVHDLEEAIELANATRYDPAGRDLHPRGSGVRGPGADRGAPRRPPALTGVWRRPPAGKSNT